MDYQVLGKRILELIGGKTNVRSLTHCATRLRFDLVDKTKVNYDVLSKLEGVISVVDKGGQYQIVIGNDVIYVYQSIMDLLGNELSNESVREKTSIVNNVISVISTTFTPVIPALTGAGMIKAFIAVLGLLNILQEGDTTLALLDTIADSVFYFLPILLAYGASTKFKVSPVLAMSIGGVLLHPNIASMMASGDKVTFLGIPVLLSGYAGSVLPIILSVWAMSYIEPFAQKICPSIVSFFVKPLLVLIISAPLALVIIGPFGTLLNDIVAAGAGYIEGIAPWLIPTLMGGLQPFLVLSGTAWAMTPIATSQLSARGSEMINGPGMLASNIAQGGATLAVSFKTKNKELKQLAASAGITAVLGITEPSLYGVTLKLKKPLLAAMIGGGIAGFYAGMVGLVRYAFVSPGLAALPAFIGKNPYNILHAVITCLIAFIISFILTIFFGFEDEINNENEHAIKINSPMAGKSITLDKVNDDVFATKILGDGIAIIPSGNEVYAPFNGRVITVLPTRHAIAIKSDDGVEMLIHIGIDTVNLEGKYFKALVKEDDIIKKDDCLLTFDAAQIKAAGYDLTSPIIITNTKSYNFTLSNEQDNLNYQDDIIKLVKVIK